MSNKKFIITRRSSGQVGARGGTEKIAQLLADNWGYQITYSDDLVMIPRGRTSILLVGLPFAQILKISTWAMFFSIELQILKTATYPGAFRRLFERLTYWVLACLLGVRFYIISSRQRVLYPQGELIDLIDLYGGEGAGDLSHGGRKYDLGYVGRVDEQKGFFEAVKFFDSLPAGKTVMLDILLWCENDRRLCENLQLSRFDVFYKTKQVSEAPKYNEIDTLYLPYKSLSSTIAVPLVVVEAVLSGCSVVVPSWLLKDLVYDFPSLKGRLISVDDFLI